MAFLGVGWPWFALASVLILLEIWLPGVGLVWLGAGAAALGTFLELAPGVSMAVFVVVLLVCMAVSVGVGVFLWRRRCARKALSTAPVVGPEDLLGRQGRALMYFENGIGRIRIDGTGYLAQAPKSAVILSGDLLAVVSVVDRVLQVLPVQNRANAQEDF